MLCNVASLECWSICRYWIVPRTYFDERATSPSGLGLGLGQARALGESESNKRKGKSKSAHMQAPTGVERLPRLRSSSSDT